MSQACLAIAHLNPRGTSLKPGGRSQHHAGISFAAMAGTTFEDQWHNRGTVIWANNKRVFESQRATSSNAGVAAGDQLPTRRTRSHPPEPSSCLSAGHYDRRHLAKDRVEPCFYRCRYYENEFCSGVPDARHCSNRLRLSGQPTLPPT